MARKPRPNRPKAHRTTKESLFKRKPKNRITADQSKQRPSNTYCPLTYYEDKNIRCIDCGKIETWTAEQQKWWYEVAKAPIQSDAQPRCRACRQKRRAAHRGTPRKLQTDRALKDKEIK